MAEPARNGAPTDSAAPEAARGFGRGRLGRVFLRLTLLPLLAALAYVVLYGHLGLGRDTSGRIHDLRSVDGCTECHPGAPFDSLVKPEPALCYGCHAGTASHTTSHPVNVTVKDRGDPGLPLFEGRMTCSTCHDPHGKTEHERLLRRKGMALCLPCHPEKGGMHHGAGDGTR